MVIAFDAKRVFHNFTGLGNYSRTLLKNLATYYPEHEYHLFTPSIKENAETNYFLNNPQFIIHTPLKNKIGWRLLHMGGHVNTLNPDIFHGLSHELPVGLNTSTIKSVVTFHDLIYEIYPQQFGYINAWSYQFRYRRSAHNSDAIIAISQSTASDLKKYYPKTADKISVIYQSLNPIFESECIEDPSLYKKEYYLYVGSITERKNLLLIVEAFRHMPDRYKKVVKIIGQGGKYAEKVKRKIIAYQLSAWFEFCGNISNDTLQSYYRNAFCLLMPSTYEGFGIPIIESLFCARPVITTDRSSLPEAMGPGGIAIHPHRPRDLVDAIISLHDPMIYDDKAHQGTLHVHSKFSGHNTAQDLIHLYKTLIS